MPLDFQTVDVKFTKGQDTRTQRKLLLPGQWDTLINYSLSKDNTPQRRDGAQPLIGAQNGNGLAVYNNELLAISAGTVATVEATSTTALAKTVPGELPYVDVSKSEVDFTTGYHDSLDCAYGNGFACYVWRDRSPSMVVNGINCTVVDLASGAKMVNATALVASTNAISPRVVFVDNAFFIFYINTSVGSTVFGHVIATAAPSTIGAAVNLAAAATVSPINFDASVSGTTANALVVFASTDVVFSVKAMTVKRTGTVPSVVSGPNPVFTQAFMADPTIAALGACVFSPTLNGIFATTIAGGNISLNGVTVDTTATFVTPATLLDTVVATAAFAPCHVTATALGTSFNIYYDQANAYLAVGFSPLRKVTCSSVLAGIVATTPMSTATYRVNGAEASGPQGPFIAGKAFTVGTSTFLPACMLEDYVSLGTNTSTNSTQCAFYLFDTTASVWAVVAGALYRTLGLVDPTLGGAAPTVQTPCSVAGPTTGAGYIIALQERGRLELTRGFNLTPVGVSAITMVPRTTSGAVSAQLGESTYVAGGQLASYDGKQIDAGLLVFPEGVSAVKTASGAGSLTVGVHQLVAVYEWTDGAGNRHQSAPSLPVSVTVVLATDQIDVLVPTTQLPQSAGYNASVSTLSIICYMTTAGGVTLYRAPSNDVSPTLNLTTASRVSFNIGATRTMPDSVLSGNEPLYTQPLQAGTTLPNIAPGPVSALADGQDRLWFLPADRPLAYGFSQEVLPNTGLQFNQALGGTLPSDSGGGVGIAMLDEKVVIFGRRRIYIVYGNAPDSSGANNGLGKPVDIQSDVGCSDARSILAEMPEGIMFKSDLGWHMLGRDLSVKYVGAGVSKFDQYAVNSAVLLEDRKEARFALGSAADGTVGGATLVYSTLVNDWSVTLYGANLLHGLVTSDAAWWPPLKRYVWTSTVNGLLNDVPGTPQDGWGTGPSTASFYGYARTGFLKVGALEGFQRVRWLYLTASGDAALNSTLSLIVYFNDSYGDTAGYTVTPISTLALATAAGNVEAVDLRHKIQKLQKCKSIAFAFVDIPTNDLISSGLGGLQAMALELGLKKGVRRLPPGQTV